MNLGPTHDRETNIQWHHNANIAHVYTCDERMITRLKKNPVAKLVEVHRNQQGQITGMEFTIPVWSISIRTARRQVTEEQRAAFVTRVRTARAGALLRGQSDPS
jgi:hypothetical protein